MQAQGGAPLLSPSRAPGALGRIWPIALSAAVTAADQVSKLLARSFLATEDLTVIEGFLSLRLSYNTGAIFGLFAGGRWFFLSLAPVITVVLVIWSLRAQSALERSSAGLILGGVIGNSWDRLLAPEGRVTDFIDFSFWPSFNVADSALVAGLVIYVGWYALSRKRAASQDGSAAGADSSEPGDGVSK